jgi:hypothetical protein
MSKAKAVSEAKLDHLVDWMNWYGHGAAILDRWDDIESIALAAYTDAVESEMSFDRLNNIIRMHARSEELLITRPAWLGQHLFKSRALCVGNRLLTTQRGEWQCPLVDQMQWLGLEARPVQFPWIARSIQAYPFSQTLDALFWLPDQQTIIPLKSVPLKRLKFDGFFNPAQLKLFPTEAQSSEAYVDSKYVYALTVAQWLLGNAFPRLTVRPHLLLVDSEGWHHELYETTGVSLREVFPKQHPLGKLRLRHSTICNANLLPQSPELVPSLPVAHPLDALPVTRAMRCHMMLNTLWERQATQTRLHWLSSRKLTKGIEERHLVHYPTEMKRHDIEDCLENGRLIQRPLYHPGSFALTPAGVMTVLLMQQQLRAPRRVTEDLDIALLSPIRDQARFWKEYMSGQNNIADH